jgi:hypothetical protein
MIDVFDPEHAALLLNWDFFQLFSIEWAILIGCEDRALHILQQAD